MSRLSTTLLSHVQLRGARGASALEYSLLVVILVVGLVVWFRQFGDSVADEAIVSANTIEDEMALTSTGTFWQP